MESSPVGAQVEYRDRDRDSTHLRGQHLPRSSWRDIGQQPAAPGHRADQWGEVMHSGRCRPGLVEVAQWMREPEREGDVGRCVGVIDRRRDFRDARFAGLTKPWPVVARRVTWAYGCSRTKGRGNLAVAESVIYLDF
jgi:hypothetical protein